MATSSKFWFLFKTESGKRRLSVNRAGLRGTFPFPGQMSPSFLSRSFNSLTSWLDALQTGDETDLNCEAFWKTLANLGICSALGIIMWTRMISPLPCVKTESCHLFSHTARRWNGQDLNSSLLDGISYPYESGPVVPTMLWIIGAVILVPSSQLTQLWTRGTWATAKGCLSDQRRCRAVVSCRSFRASVKNLYLRSAMKPYDLRAKDDDDDSLPLLSSFCIPSIFVEHTVCISWFKLGENPPVIGAESHTSVIIQLSVTSILGLKS